MIHLVHFRAKKVGLPLKMVNPLVLLGRPLLITLN